MITKKEIINEIKRIDQKQGHFFENGSYRYGIKFYYGKLEKYNKDKLNKILENLRK
jgi:hypothetical protein